MNYVKTAQKRCPASPDKIQYHTHDFAREVADRRQVAEKTVLYVYNCVDCGKWHITKRRGDEVVLVDEVEGGVKPFTTETPRKPMPQRNEAMLKEAQWRESVAAYLRTVDPERTITATLLVKEGLVPYREVGVRVLVALGWTRNGYGRGSYWTKDTPVTKVVEGLGLEEDKPTLRLIENGVPKVQVPPPVPARAATVDASMSRHPAGKQRMSVAERTLDIEALRRAGLTIHQMILAYEALGLEVEITVRAAHPATKPIH